MGIKLAFFQGRQIAARDAFNGFETIEVFLAMELDELVRMKYCHDAISSGGK
jgi:hypothetical protein